MPRRLLKALPLLLLLPLPFLLIRTQFARSLLLSLVAFVRESGATGLALFWGVEAIMLACTAPIWIMSGLAGYAYGFWKGVLIACPGVTLGACVAFTLGRVSIGRYLKSRPGEGQFWRAVERAVRDEGLKITVLLRLNVVVPQNLCAYMLSATPLSYRDFALGTFVGLAPVTIFQVYLGSTVESALALVSGKGAAQGPLAWAMFVAAGIATLLAVLFTSRIARRALDKALVDPQKRAA